MATLALAWVGGSGTHAEQTIDQLRHYHELSVLFL